MCHIYIYNATIYNNIDMIYNLILQKKPSIYIILLRSLQTINNEMAFFILLLECDIMTINNESEMIKRGITFN